MSARCNIEIYDGKSKNAIIGARLYHHSDGYPDFMEGKLKSFLKAAYEYLKEAGYPYWWNSERVAAILVALSIEDYSIPLKPFSTNRANKYEMGIEEYRPNSGIPVFQPCLENHGDIEYIWKVYLYGEGKFSIKYEKTY